jgi:hypothetical protein
MDSISRQSESRMKTRLSNSFRNEVDMKHTAADESCSSVIVYILHGLFGFIFVRKLETFTQASKWLTPCMLVCY